MFDQGQFYPYQPMQFMDGLLNPIIGAGAANPVLTYITAVSSTSALTTYTFTAASIGTASADRLVVVAAQGLTTVGRTISGVTIATVSATSVSNSASNNSQSGIFSLNVTSGTTADIAVTFSGANSRCVAHIYTITGLSSFTAVGADATASAGATTLNRTIAISSGGCSIGTAWVGNNPSTISWTNLTKNDGITASLGEFSAASDKDMALNAGLVITATGSGSAGAATLAVASWR